MSIFKGIAYSCQWTQIFFDFLKDLLKRSSYSVYWKLSFHYLSYSQCKWIFCLVGNSILFGRSYFDTSKNQCWNQKKIGFKERANSFQYITDLVASANHFFSIFQSLLPVMAFSRLVETFFQRNPSSSQWKRIFRQVETVFFCSNGFSLSRNHQ